LWQRSINHYVVVKNLDLYECLSTGAIRGVYRSVAGVWSKNSSCPLAYARTSLQAQVNDKSGSVDPLLGPVRTHPFRTDLTQRSANEFKFGLLAGKRIVLTLPGSISSGNDAQNLN
jgi:hypothetical protein